MEQQWLLFSKKLFDKQCSIFDREKEILSLINADDEKYMNHLKQDPRRQPNATSLFKGLFNTLKIFPVSVRPESELFTTSEDQYRYSLNEITLDDSNEDSDERYNSNKEVPERIELENIIQPSPSKNISTLEIFPSTPIPMSVRETICKSDKLRQFQKWFPVIYDGVCRIMGELVTSNGVRSIITTAVLDYDRSENVIITFNSRYKLPSSDTIDTNYVMKYLPCTNNQYFNNHSGSLLALSAADWLKRCTKFARNVNGVFRNNTNWAENVSYSDWIVQRATVHSRQAFPSKFFTVNETIKIPRNYKEISDELEHIIEICQTGGTWCSSLKRFLEKCGQNLNVLQSIKKIDVSQDQKNSCKSIYIDLDNSISSIDYETFKSGEKFNSTFTNVEIKLFFWSITKNNENKFFIRGFKKLGTKLKLVEVHSIPITSISSDGKFVVADNCSYELIGPMYTFSILCGYPESKNQAYLDIFQYYFTQGIPTNWKNIISIMHIITQCSELKFISPKGSIFSDDESFSEPSSKSDVSPSFVPTTSFITPFKKPISMMELLQSKSSQINIKDKYAISVCDLGIYDNENKLQLRKSKTKDFRVFSDLSNNKISRKPVEEIDNIASNENIRNDNKEKENKSNKEVENLRNDVSMTKTNIEEKQISESLNSVVIISLTDAMFVDNDPIDTTKNPLKSFSNHKKVTFSETTLANSSKSPIGLKEVKNSTITPIKGSRRLENKARNIAESLIPSSSKSKSLTDLSDNAMDIFQVPKKKVKPHTTKEIRLDNKHDSKNRGTNEPKTINKKNNLSCCTTETTGSHASKKEHMELGFYRRQLKDRDIRKTKSGRISLPPIDPRLCLSFEVKGNKVYINEGGSCYLQRDFEKE